jgi:hypothetical protein
MKTIDQLEKKDTPNIHNMLSSPERSLRSILLNKMNKILQSSEPVPISEIMSLADAAGVDVSTTIASLKEKGLIALQDDANVTGLYPFSAVPTRHKVQLKGGRTVFAMCAIDSLGVAYELEQDSVISSSCSHCNLPIAIEITNGEISLIEPASSRAIHVALGDYKDWASTC